MSHIWSYEDWKDIKIGDMKSVFMPRARRSPRLTDMTVGNLCSLACDKTSPVGIYVFSRESDIVYVGKTHGRSLHERTISHIDNRAPVEGSPHLARLVTTLVNKGQASDETEAVYHILNMKVTWMPIPTAGLGVEEVKKSIAGIERRLLWKECLNPGLNSERVKRNSYFTLKGVKYILDTSDPVGKLLVNESVS
jgi:hypothetical protein